MTGEVALDGDVAQLIGCASTGALLLAHDEIRHKGAGKFTIDVFSLAGTPR